jgi:hypothetical protein
MRTNYGGVHQKCYKIKQIQYEAVIIITGLPNLSSLESLYFETG